MSGKNAISRRRFLSRAGRFATGALAVPHVVRSTALGKAGRAAPSDRITVGCIGVGNQGRQVMRNFLAQGDAQVVAVCDVKARELAYARRFVDRHYGGEGCAAYGDFRGLLACEGIDTALIATPDHWHVLIALAAARAGKDIYLEKPVGLSLAEDQALRAAVRRYGTVFQFGTHQRSDARFHLACERARNGCIGELRRVHVWCPGSRAGGSVQPAPVAAGLDYDMWLGPAPFVPHTEHRCANVFPGTRDPYKIWPFIGDYCLGWVAGWGVHALDIALWGGGERLTGPLEIEGTGTFPAEGACDTATNWDLVIRFGRGTVMEFRGAPAPAAWQTRYASTSDHGTAFEGTEGWVCVDRSRVSAHPKGLLKSSFRADEARLYRSVDHVGNFLECVRSRAETICPIDGAVAVDTLCQLSAIALRLERKLTWDAEKERFIADEEANRLLRARAMRGPWHL
ncbi:MAG TPA: Gfo/Idh/MocA family oxidoreductase [Phycisphaerae bacterium]|nr:Gfo/Idh/MocA family oxidoreductase [Phycisphaerae bacterium]